MSNYNHYPDMDHDGDHDLKDSGMFHDMDQSSRATRYHFQPTKGELIALILILIYLGAVLNGTIPLNWFTGLLGIIFFIVFLVLIDNVMVPW